MLAQEKELQDEYFQDSCDGAGQFNTKTDMN